MSNVVKRVNTLLNGKSYIIIDSSYRVSGTAESFLFMLPDLISNVKSVKPIYTIMSNNVYNITQLSN